MTGVIKWRDENGVWHEIPALRGGDGFSPVISVDKIDGGHRVTITDAAGTKTFDVADGKNGSGSGTSGADGEDGGYYYPTVTDGVLSWSASKAGMPAAEAANVKGEKGDKGDPGERGEAGPEGAAGATGPQGPAGPQGEPGSQGEKGEDGYTPVKGTDYYTDADKAELVQAVKDGLTRETWTFTLEDGSTVSKVVLLG